MEVTVEEVVLVVIDVVEAALPVGCLDALVIRTRQYNDELSENRAGTCLGRSLNGLPWIAVTWPKSAGLYPYPIHIHPNMD